MTQPRNLSPDEPCDCHLGPDLAIKLVEGKGHAAFALRGDIRAVEQGHHAFVVSTNEHELEAELTRWRVVSNCRHERSYGLTLWHRPGASLPARASCNCESGRYRGPSYPVPCKHVALVMRSAERRGWLLWREGLWWHPEAWAEAQRRSQAVLDEPNDPFEGLQINMEEEEL